MIVYIIMLFFSVVFAYYAINEKNKSKRVVIEILSAIPFILVSGLRYDVGTDYMNRYVPDFFILLEGYDIGNLEIGMKFLIKFCIFILNDYEILFFIISILVNGLVFYAIFKYSKNPILSIIIYFISTNFFLSLNLVRQYISISIFLAGYRLFFDKKNIVKFIICAIIAFLFHTISLIFIPFLFFNKKVLNIYSIAIASIIIGLYSSKIIFFLYDKLLFVLPSSFKKYNYYRNVTGNFSFSQILVELVVYLYMYYIYIRCKKCRLKLDKEGILFLNLQAFSVVFTSGCYNMGLFSRVAVLFSAFQILSISYFYEKNKEMLEKEKRENYININQKLSFILFLAVIFVFSLRFIYSSWYKGANEVFPYKSIIDRPLDVKKDMNMDEYLNNRKIK